MSLHFNRRTGYRTGVVHPGSGVVGSTPHCDLCPVRLVEENIPAGSERDRSVHRPDLALVIDKTTEKNDVTAGRRDRSEVGHTCLAVSVESGRSAIQEVLIVNIESREVEQSRHIDPSAGPDNDPVRVDEDNPAIRLQGSVDRTRVSPDHPVQRDGTRIRLDKRGCFALRN